MFRMCGPAWRPARLRRRPVVGVLLCGVLGAVLPAGYAWCAGIPEPQIHDEFSYLLAADTYAQGRLTNPSPELPEFFEAEHVLLVPTYMSKYPPGQGLVMALGQVACGMPACGVWFSCGVFAASLYWMLLGWTSARWALATTLAAILINMASYWSQSYWGGMAAASGGALLFGGLRRTLRRPQMSSSLLMGLGIVVLAITRPFEGLLACLPVAASMAWWLATDPTVRLQRKMLLWLLPVSGTCCAGAAALALDNQAVTGAWWELPYVLHQRQYYSGGVTLFSESWIPSRIPCERIVRFYNPLSLKETIVPPDAPAPASPAAGRQDDSIDQERDSGKPQNLVHEERNPNNPAKGTVRAAQSADPSDQIAVRSSPTFLLRALNFTVFGFTGIATGDSPWGAQVAVLVSVVVLVAGWKDKWARFCWLTMGTSLLGASTVWAWFPHYAAPVLPLLYGTVAIALRRLGLVRGTWLPPRSIRPAMLVGVVLVVFIVNHGESIARQTVAKVSSPAQALFSTGHTTPRSSVLEYLRNRSGTHLVFVRYSAEYSIHDEWVYNPADMNSAPVLFAHDLGFEKNGELIERHPDRFVWLATLTTEDRSLIPYPD